MIALDTNIIIYAIHFESSHNKAAQSLLKRLATQNTLFALASQTVPESINVLCKYLNLPTGRALGAINRVIEDFQIKIAYPNAQTLSVFSALMKDAGSSTKTFDMFLAATLLSNDIHTLYTFNKKDFQHIRGLTLPDISA